MRRRRNTRSHDYQGDHTPPGPEDVAEGAAAPFHAIESVMPDYYAHPEWYRTGGDREWEATGPILGARNHPTKQVRVYRAVPKSVKKINAGDWVTQSRGYAKEHLQSNLNGDGKILSVLAKAGSLFTNGDSHFEWGWWPDAGREKAYDRERTARLAPKWKAEREAREAKYGMSDEERYGLMLKKNPPRDRYGRFR